MNAHKSATILAIIIAISTLIWTPGVTHAAPSSGWIQITNNNDTTAIYAIYSGGSKIFQLKGDYYGTAEGIYEYQGMSTGGGRDGLQLPAWMQIADGRWHNCAVNVGSQLFCINSYGDIYSWYSNFWSQVGGSATAIYAGGNELYSMQQGTGDIYHYLGQTGQWARIGGPGKMFVVNGQGQLFGITPDGSAVATWSPTNPVWTQIGGPAAVLYAGGNELYGVQPGTGNVYRYLGSPFQWAQIGGPAKMFVVDGQGSLFGITPDGSLVATWSPANPVWTKLSDSDTWQVIYGVSAKGVIGVVNNQGYYHS